jgi:hypothetical protein
MRIEYLNAPTWGGGGIGPRRGVKKLPCISPLFARQSPLLAAVNSLHEYFPQSVHKIEYSAPLEGPALVYYVLGPGRPLRARRDCDRDRDRDPVRDQAKRPGISGPTPYKFCTFAPIEDLKAQLIPGPDGGDGRSAGGEGRQKRREGGQ